MIVMGIGLKLFLTENDTNDFKQYVHTPADPYFNTSFDEKKQILKNKKLQKTEKITQRSPAHKNDRTLGRAQPPLLLGKKPVKPQSNKFKNKMAPVPSEVQTKKFEVGDQKYEKLENVYAINKDQFLPNAYELLEEKNNLYIVYVPNDIPPPEDAYTVIKEEGFDNLIIFTGRLRVKFYDYGQVNYLVEMVNEISSSQKFYQVGINRSLEHINVATYEFNDYEQTMSFYEYLKHSRFDTVVIRVTIDMIQWQRVAK
jgi:hypothetical protein|tara:strand:+ start:55 stop:822 length:768 start_codon:yes stop_codon:yes gene_type:complete